MVCHEDLYHQDTLRRYRSPGFKAGKKYFMDAIFNGSRDILQVCLKGHVITDSFLSLVHHSVFCARCGHAAITCCPKCGKIIPGRMHYKGAPPILDPPEKCAGCNARFPWAPVE